MKNKILSCLAFIAIALSTHAQTATVVTEDTDNIDKIGGTVLRTKINRTSEKTILKEWKDKMKDYDADVDIKKNRVSATEVKIEAMGSEPLEVLGEVRKASEAEKEFIVMFLKNGTAISSASDLSAFTAMKNIVRNFANELSKEATEEYQKEQAKLYEDLQDDMEDAEKEQEKAKEDIKDAEEKIEEAKEEIKKAQEVIKEKNKFLEKNMDTRAEIKKKLSNQKTALDGANAEMDFFK